MLLCRRSYSWRGVGPRIQIKRVYVPSSRPLIYPMPLWNTRTGNSAELYLLCLNYSLNISLSDIPQMKTTSSPPNSYKSSRRETLLEHGVRPCYPLDPEDICHHGSKNPCMCLRSLPISSVRIHPQESCANTKGKLASSFAVTRVMHFQRC